MIPERVSRRLWLALFASFSLHWVAVMGLPGLGDAASPPKPLAVRMVELRPEAPIEAPRPLPVAPPAKTPPRPEKHLPAPAPKPEPTPAPAPPVAAAPPVLTRSLTAPAAPTLPATPAAEPAKAAVAERAVEVARTAPRYDAAYLTNPKPPYPRISQRRGDQGTVRLRVLVTKEGTAGDVELEKSSGFEALDESARRTVATWRFEPARRGKEAVDEWFIVPIEFALKSPGDAN